MNVEIWTEAAQFPGKEYINGIFLAMQNTNITLLYEGCFLVVIGEGRTTVGSHHNPSVKMVVLNNLAVGLKRF